MQNCRVKSLSLWPRPGSTNLILAKQANSIRTSSPRDSAELSEHLDRAEAWVVRAVDPTDLVVLEGQADQAGDAEVLEVRAVLWARVFLMRWTSTKTKA